MANKNKAPFYSVVVPLYNEEDVLQFTYACLTTTMAGKGVDYELIFVNDGSRDRTEEIVAELCEKDSRVRLLSLSRNFGHQAAVTAGLDYAAGDAIVIIDADLQDPPNVIPDMIALWEQGYDVVYGKRKGREGESWFKKWTAKAFYRLLQKITDIDIPLDTGDFRLIDRKVCDALKGLEERNRFIRGLVSWVGFKQIAIEYERDARFAGETKYPLKRMLKFAMDGIVAFSYKPLQAAGILGIAMVSGGTALLMILLIMAVFTNDLNVTGWLFIAPVFLIGQGIVLVFIGILGEYIGRLFDEARKRPVYIMGHTVGKERSVPQTLDTKIPENKENN